MQRVDFNLGFYAYLAGASNLLTRARLLGAPAHDQRDKYVCVAPLSAPRGLGIVAEYQPISAHLTTHRRRCLSQAHSRSRAASGGEVYRDRKAVTEALIPIVNAELKAIEAAGADFCSSTSQASPAIPMIPIIFLTSSSAQSLA